MAAPLRRSTRIDGSAGGEPLSCGNQSTYNRVANAGNLHRLSPFQMPFGILHNLTGKSSLTFSIEKCHFITAILPLCQRICGQLHVAGQFGIFCLLLFQLGAFGLQFCLLGKDYLETFNVVGTTGCLHQQSRWFPYSAKKRSALRFFAE